MGRGRRGRSEGGSWRSTDRKERREQRERVGMRYRRQTSSRHILSTHSSHKKARRRKGFFFLFFFSSSCFTQGETELLSSLPSQRQPPRPRPLAFLPLRGSSLPQDAYRFSSLLVYSWISSRYQSTSRSSVSTRNRTETIGPFDLNLGLSASKDEDGESEFLLCVFLYTDFES